MFKMASRRFRPRLRGSTTEPQDRPWKPPRHKGLLKVFLLLSPSISTIAPHLSKQMRGAYTVANRPFSFLKDAHSNNLRKKQSGGKRND